MQLGHPQLEQLRTIVAAKGERETSRLLLVPRGTLARLLAGLPVRRGTLVLAERGIAELSLSHATPRAKRLVGRK